MSFVRRFLIGWALGAALVSALVEGMNVNSIMIVLGIICFFYETFFYPQKTP